MFSYFSMQSFLWQKRPVLYLSLLCFVFGLLSTFGNKGASIGLALFYFISFFCAIRLKESYPSTLIASPSITAFTLATWCGFAIWYHIFQLDTFTMTKAIGSLYWVLLMATGYATLEVRYQEHLNALSKAPSELQ